MTSDTHIHPAQEPTATIDEERSTVVVIEDDKSMRDALDSLLRSVGIDVICFESTRQYMLSEHRDGPTCLVLDVRMPGQSGIEFQRQLSQSNNQLPIIFITGHGDIPMSVAAMKAGAIEFLTKPFREQDLLDAIARGLEKDRVRRRDEAAARHLHDKYAELSTRERDIMQGVVSGRPNKHIAAELGLSEITVKVHRGQVMRKMQASSLPDLVRMADQLAIAFTSARQR